MKTKKTVAKDESNKSQVKSDSSNRVSLVKRFDEICFSIGDCDAVELIDAEDGTTSSVCYFELQEHSKSLAAQLFHRYRPDYVLVDCKGWVVPEAVATLACMRLEIPFVPVSCYDQHRPGKLEQVVHLLQQQKKTKKHTSSTLPSVVVAVTVCDNDRDPILSVFQQAGVHQILYLDAKTGSLNEQLNVPDKILAQEDIIVVQESPQAGKRSNNKGTIDPTDDLYVLFTSGTSRGPPKAVVGSHSATFHRIQWFLDHVEQQQTDTNKKKGGIVGSSRIGRRSKLTFVDGVNELWSGLLDPTSVLVSVPLQHLQKKGIACLYDKCSHLLLLPSQLQQMLLLPKSQSLKRVLVSGEVCSSFLVTQFYAKYDFTECQLYNLYGQTESTGDVCFALLTPPPPPEISRQNENSNNNFTVVVQGCVTIGTPILDTIQIKLQNVVPDEAFEDANTEQPVQELILMGADQLANGYLTESGEGRQPFSSFATGDIGFHENGQWYIQGRKNDIVKMNGIWTSPTEIEATFSKAYELSQATMVVAVILPDSTGGQDSSGQQQYKSYVLCTERKACQKFSRRDMHEIQQVPWNAVPNDVFLVESIPRSTSGAAKVNRRACTQLVVELLEARRQKGPSSMAPQAATTPNNDGSIILIEATLLSLVASALSIPIESVDKSKSFVEMGGNSATSITLLYLIRQRQLNLDAQVLAELSVLDILNAPSLEHLWARMTGAEPPSKRVKVVAAAASSHSNYEEPKLVSHSACHQSIRLQACVDATPLLVDSSSSSGQVIYAACQGGMIVKFQAESRTILAHRYFHGWMIQADLLYLEDSKRLVVAAHSMDGKGMILVLSSDLNTTHWEQEVLDGPVKTAPVLLQNQLWVLAGSTVLALNVASGTRVINIEVVLPHPCCTRPLVVSKNDGSNHLAYASSDWDACLMMINTADGSITKILEYEIGPVHKGMLPVDDETAWIAGSYGIAHLVNLEKGEVQMTQQPSSSPLSSMTRLPNNANRYIVGSYDGVIRCLDSEKGVPVWETPIGASIYAKPTIIQWKDGNDKSVKVATITTATTTAGDVAVLDSENGTILWRHRIPAEIWSTPVFLSKSKTIVFGARDSCLHFIQIPL
ncbi:unnamed protein product [Cylindrotheca closterium]|uniref:Carrier domain-containing protein n=1 Tax=Cylindrotheca closterium TaxID=2856 RepID=A0AAD2CWJ0_9STRA|nr:unnamed protein product [Cylindrotheca closterium]